MLCKNIGQPVLCNPHTLNHFNFTEKKMGCYTLNIGKALLWNPQRGFHECISFAVNRYFITVKLDNENCTDNYVAHFIALQLYALRIKHGMLHTKHCNALDTAN